MTAKPQPVAWAAVTRVLAAGVPLGLLLAACGGGSSLSDAEWAAAMCRISEDLEVIVSVLDEGAHGTSLPLDERIDRAEGLWHLLAVTSEGASAELDDISPPGGARGYHEALATHLSDVGEVFRDVEAGIEDARTLEDIEALSAQTNLAVERTKSVMRAAGEDLGDHATAALRGIRNCGPIT